MFVFRSPSLAGVGGSPAPGPERSVCPRPPCSLASSVVHLQVDFCRLLVCGGVAQEMAATATVYASFCLW